MNRLEYADRLANYNPAARELRRSGLLSKNRTPNRREYARRYAEARKFRRQMFRDGFLNTGYALGGYIIALRTCWAFARRNP